MNDSPSALINVRPKYTRLDRQAGFTLVELVMIIVVIGVLSKTALPRFFDIESFQQHGFFNDTLNAIRYAQKLAVATGCNVHVAISGNQFELKRPAAADRSLCDSTAAGDFT
ncbi:pilus assembly FimT family protein, partial [Methylomonas rivi]